MKKYLILFHSFIFLIILSACNQSGINYPKTKKVDQTDNYYGVQIEDPYRWLEDDNSEETKAWVKAQNELTFNYLQQIPFRDKIINRTKEIWNFERISALNKDGGKYFFYKNDGLQDQPVLYYKNKLNEEPIEIINPNKLSEDSPVSLTNYDVSKDGRYIAFSLSSSGSDWNEIYIKEIKSGVTLNDQIKWVKFSNISWYKDGFFYSSYDKPIEGKELSNANTNHKIFYHKVGQKQKKDELIFENKSYPNRIYVAYLTSDEKYLIISESETTSGNSIYIKNLFNNEEDFTKLTTSFDYEYEVIDHINDNLIVLTNYKAPKYKLIKINVNSLEIGKWKDIIPEKSNVLIDVEISKNNIIANYIKDAQSKLEMYDLYGVFKKEINLPTIGTVNELNSSRDEDLVYYSFSSFTIPTAIYQLDTKSSDSKIYFKPNLSINSEKYITKQVFYRSKDGAKIPMFIVHKKDLELNGQNPTLLYGYGGFNISIMPRFSVFNLIWLENNGIYASANIRGGGEYGENWHLSGTIFNKQNVFDDFIFAAQYLIDEKYTSSDYLAINGASNGGLLIGTVANQRPDLFKVAIPSVGVMDMLRFHKFTIGWAWVSDYGSSEDSAQCINLLKYSPLHNIKKNINYPAILITTADHDDRVVPAHSFKYAATLQKIYKGENPVLIRIQTQAGHGSGTPASVQIEEIGDIISFTLYNMGLTSVY